jgi:hypothetical protein
MVDSPNIGEIFIIDEEIAQDFFDEDNYYRAELFFNYLSSWCECSHAYMIPSLHRKISDWIKRNTANKDTLTQTKAIADFKNWVEEANLLGEDDGNNDEHDTELLFNLLSLSHPDRDIKVVSSKYKNHPKLKSIDSDELFEFIGKKKDFMDFFERKYNIGNWDSSY